MFGVGDSPFGRSLARLGLVRDGRITPGRATLLSVGVTWLPLLFLSLVEGVAWGGVIEVPFLNDFLPYGQFFFAVPALILAELVIGRRLAGAAAELYRSGVVTPESRPALSRLFDRAASAWDGPVVNGVILVLTIAAIVASVIEVREWLTGGWQYTGGRLTLPGWWYLLVSLPVMRFLALRWLWRLLVWAWVLWRTATLELQPQPVHPDRAGGLAFLGEAQMAFGVLVFAFGIQLSSLIADRVHYQGADLMGFRAQVLSYVALAVLVLLLPLLAFVPKLARARYDSLLFLSGRGYEGAGELERRLRSRSGDELPDQKISGLADYGTVCESARLMRAVPLEWRHVLVILLAAVLPFLPLAFLVMPAQEVLKTLAKLLM